MSNYNTSSAAALAVHSSVSVAKLKAFCKTMGEMRYVLAPDGKLHIGCSSNMIHNNIKNRTYEHISKPEGMYIQGYARHRLNEDGKDIFEHWVSYTCDEHEGNFHSGTHVRQHLQDPRIDSLHERGFARSFSCF